MKKKASYGGASDDENEFDVDEPEEIQNNASDDDWTPDRDNSSGRRTSTRLRNLPKSRAPIVDASSTDEEGSDEGFGSKRKAPAKGRPRGRAPVKKPKIANTTFNSTLNSTPTIKSEKSVSSDSEPSSTTNTPTSTTPVLTNLSSSFAKHNKDFTSGAFVILKTDAANLEQDPPLWKIDGKALLQKYIPFQQEGKTYYKNTSVYSGWTLNNKDNYFPVTVIFKQQTRKEHIVEFHRNQIKLVDADDENSSGSTANSTNADKSTPSAKDGDKPVIKVKSFAIVQDEESNSLSKSTDRPLTPNSGSAVNTLTINKDFVSGAFLVLRTEASNVDPPLWKIDGKALLQKYNPFVEEGKTLYKNTAEYSGWTLSNKGNYFPVSVVFKQQNKKEHVVALDRIKWDEPEDSGKE
ncbi:uncharacterized protein LOC129002951 [Macrosteles quadrilineatus]|uniref:uncharacterized protein LOC129002951 n=1 Tax=Macrosteles quadrilineatus TaxID=74068 RepID=UPI0023E28637|nr:uncharacterized protein LOC129002951 [Macrosteles quadrilineatus]